MKRVKFVPKTKVAIFAAVNIGTTPDVYERVVNIKLSCP